MPSSPKFLLLLHHIIARVAMMSHTLLLIQRFILPEQNHISYVVYMYEHIVDFLSRRAESSYLYTLRYSSTIVSTTNKCSLLLALKDEGGQGKRSIPSFHHSLFASYVLLVIYNST